MGTYLFRVLVTLGMFINALFGGKTYQSLCARQYHRQILGKTNLVPIIDFLFSPVEKEHCRKSYIYWLKLTKGKEVLK